ncbi:DUF7172 family protein [Nocardia nova]|jgi:hypothetical protein|uniref:DUF7172 family protein n=1 Tax=Nocardia nova TaxID=37330 RepID=UPI001894467B|nr:hypothetical protein [Nocardia nova]MBF6277085.1 hypothetical protein [Nocardia nova]
MTYPCVNSSYFDATDGVLAPLRKWQMNRRAVQSAGGATFTPANNSAGTTLFSVLAQWTNDTGIPQQVWAVMTQGPQRYVIDGLKHLSIRTQWGTSYGAAPADPTMTEESRLRGYPDFGTGTGSGSTTVAVYAQLEDRSPTLTVPIGDVVTLPAGQTFKAKAQVSWSTPNWGIDWYSGWGDPTQIRVGKVGPITLELFSTPVFP